MNADNVPTDPATGRAIIGGRARRLPAPIPVVMPHSNLVHLVDMHARWEPGIPAEVPWPKTLCGAWCGELVTVATVVDPMCGPCARRTGR